jgi:hypothetical protein
MKFKMAATTGLSLTLDSMGKMFHDASSLKPLGQLKLFYMPIGNPSHPMNIHVQFSFDHICSF